MEWRPKSPRYRPEAHGRLSNPRRWFRSRSGEATPKRPDLFAHRSGLCDRPGCDGDSRWPGALLERRRDVARPLALDAAGLRRQRACDTRSSVARSRRPSATSMMGCWTFRTARLDGAALRGGEPVAASRPHSIFRRCRFSSRGRCSTMHTAQRPLSPAAIVRSRRGRGKTNSANGAATSSARSTCRCATPTAARSAHFPVHAARISPDRRRTGRR